jgi:hypothetical protein
LVMPGEREILKFYAVFRRIASDCTTVTLGKDHLHFLGYTLQLEYKGGDYK